MMVKLGLVYFMAPLLLILPIMVASEVMADGFTREKERGTCDALVYAPPTNCELFMAKAL